jgi:serine/threonine protein kinase
VHTTDILVAEGYVCKLGDFGESRGLTSEETMTIVGWVARAPDDFNFYVAYLTNAHASTPMFCAPEVLRGDSYDQSADAFSFALTLVACLKKGRAYGDEVFRVSNVRVRTTSPPTHILWLPLDHWRSAAQYKNARPRIPTGTPESLRKLIKDCWNEDPLQRPFFGLVVDKLEKELEYISRRKADVADAEFPGEAALQGRGGGEREVDAGQAFVVAEESATGSTIRRSIDVYGASSTFSQGF